MIESEKVNSLYEELKSYIDNRIRLLKIKLIEDLSDGIAELISFAIIGIVGAIFFFLISILAGISLSVWLDNYLLGFGIVSGTYLAIFLILFFFRKSFLKLPLQNSIIKYLFKKND